MASDYDPECAAEVAIKPAAATDWPERQPWISLAMAWQELARVCCEPPVSERKSSQGS